MNLINEMDCQIIQYWWTHWGMGEHTDTEQEINNHNEGEEEDS
jgi:hypothetical protein